VSKRRRRSARRSSRGKRPGGAIVVLIGAAVVVALAAYLFADVGADELRMANPAPWSGGRVRVEVLNGGGVDGMARAGTEILRTAGFDVVSFGNAASFDHERPSSVIDRVGRADLAQAVARTLGIDNVQSNPDPNLYVDVSVVLGREWMGPGDAQSAEETDVPGSWDPRSWFGR